MRMTSLKVQSRNEDVYIVALDERVVMADVSRAEAEAILATYGRAVGREKARRARGL
jgi:hypothetical protein